MIVVLVLAARCRLSTVDTASGAEMDKGKMAVYR